MTTRLYNLAYLQDAQLFKGFLDYFSLRLQRIARSQLSTLCYREGHTRSLRMAACLASDNI